jgi:hypothetical protein
VGSVLKTPCVHAGVILNLRSILREADRHWRDFDAARQIFGKSVRMTPGASHAQTSHYPCPAPHAVKYGRCRYNAISKRGKILAYEDLRGWIAALERAGELKTIRTEVDPVLEITEITDRVSKGNSSKSAGGPALLFQNASPDQPVWLRSPHESRS